MYRALTTKEVERAFEQKENRTKYEKRACRLLPCSMKQHVERNPAIGFEGYEAFYPDLFFRKEKICIEIDGGYHLKRQFLDAYRDKVFREHGFIVIRIKNEDTEVDAAFWQRLLEGLEKDGADRSDLNLFKHELRQMIEEEIHSWTRI